MQMSRPKLPGQDGPFLRKRLATWFSLENSWTTIWTTDIDERHRGVQGQDKGLPSVSGGRGLEKEGVGFWLGALNGSLAWPGLAASDASRFHP